MIVSVRQVEEALFALKMRWSFWKVGDSWEGGGGSIDTLQVRRCGCRGRCCGGGVLARAGSPAQEEREANGESVCKCAQVRKKSA